MENDFSVLRASVFFGVLITMLSLERLWPRRARSLPAWPRLGTNLGLIFIDTLVVRLALPLGVIGVAAIATANGWGLFALLPLPPWLEFIASLLLLDLGIYAQHFAVHRFGWLWRIHRVHHADPDFDTTTGIRFHPLEILLSTLYKCALEICIGPTASAVLTFEVILNATALFNHANLALPRRLDVLLRLFLVTPDVHRVHHSCIPSETHSNFGFNLTLWDRLFGTWNEQPAQGHSNMEIGLPEYRNRSPARLAWCLKLPFSD